MSFIIVFLIIYLTVLFYVFKIASIQSYNVIIPNTLGINFYYLNTFLESLFYYYPDLSNLNYIYLQSYDTIAI